MAEILAHIEDGAARRQEANPGLTRQQAAAEAIDSFCPADDLGVAVGPRGGITRSSTGELLLPVAVLSGQGLGRHAAVTQAWTAVAAAGSVALVAAVAFAAFLATQPEDGGFELASLDAGRERATLLHQQWWGASGFGNTTVDAPDWPNGFTLALDAGGIGCVSARLYDPTGAPAIDGWDANRSDCGAVDGTATSTQRGPWRLELHFQDYSGYVRLDASKNGS